MRWLFFLVVVLNLFYYLWHQQQAPLSITEVAPAPAYRHSQARLNLLSEKAAPSHFERGGSIPEQNAGAGAAAELCIFLGDYPRREGAEVLLQQLRTRGVDGDLVVREVVSGEDFWVFLPPLASRQAAIRQLRELQARNIDSYVITMGELENGISLGIYSRRSAAESFSARVSALGYSAEIRLLPRTHRRFAVRVSSDASSHGELQTMLSQLDPALLLAKGACEAVAQ